MREQPVSPVARDAVTGEIAPYQTPREGFPPRGLQGLYRRDVAEGHF